MSNPSDPFGRSERTIIRPNPGGRRVAPAAQPMAPPPPAPPSPGVPGGGDEWANMQPQRPPEPVAGQQPRAPVLKREDLVTPNQNVMLKAAAPLLLLLGRMRVSLMRAPAGQLMDQVADVIENFDHEVRGAGFTEAQTRVAKYVVCATADDIVQNIPSEERHVWTQYSMLSRFFGERVGGVRFFEELERAVKDPSVNYDLLELMHACLALGFQGIHRTSAGGAANLQMIQRNLYETLRRVRRANPELSPRWQGQAIVSQATRFRVPVWAVGSVAALALLGLYFVLRALLSGNAEAASTALLSVHPTSQIGIQRKVFAPPPPPPPPQTAKVCGAVQPPVTCDVTPNTILVRLVDITLFEPARAEVRNEFRPLIERIANVLETEGGAVKVIGHTDSQPIRSSRFASNFELSVARAKSVADLLKTKLSKPDRISTEGRGADAPIASNATVDGRAKNRRVEVLIQRN